MATCSNGAWRRRIVYEDRYLAAGTGHPCKHGRGGNLYLCQRTGESAGGTVVLQYMPHELVGHYFVKVT